MAKVLPDLSQTAANTMALAAKQNAGIAKEATRRAAAPQGEPVGRNVRASMEGHVLVIRIDTKAAGTNSASGKSVVIATTNGNVGVPGTGGAKLGVNFYMPNA